MSHHGTDYPGEFMPGHVDPEKVEQLKKALEIKEEMVGKTSQSPAFGATGEFPEGKLNENDEGAIVFGIGIDNGNIILNFGKPVAWVGMNPSQAIEVAKSLIEKAKETNPNRADFGTVAAQEMNKRGLDKWDGKYDYQTNNEFVMLWNYALEQRIRVLELQGF